MQAASAAKIHSRNWQRIEAGELNAMLRTLVRIAAVLAVGPAELLRRLPRKAK